MRITSKSPAPTRMRVSPYGTSATRNRSTARTSGLDMTVRTTSGESAASAVGRPCRGWTDEQIGAQRLSRPVDDRLAEAADHDGDGHHHRKAHGERRDRDRQTEHRRGDVGHRQPVLDPKESPDRRVEDARDAEENGRHEKRRAENDREGRHVAEHRKAIERAVSSRATRPAPATPARRRDRPLVVPSACRPDRCRGWPQLAARLRLRCAGTAAAISDKGTPTAERQHDDLPIERRRRRRRSDVERRDGRRRQRDRGVARAGGPSPRPANIRRRRTSQPRPETTPAPALAVTPSARSTPISPRRESTATEMVL